MGWDQERWWLLWVLLLLSSSTWFDCLHVPIDRRDVVAGEHARLAVAAPFPPVGVGVVQDLDEVPAPEAQLPFLLGVEVKERLHVRGMLQAREGGQRGGHAMYRTYKN